VGDLADLYHSTVQIVSAYSFYYGPGPSLLSHLPPNQYLRAADLLGNYSSSTYNAEAWNRRRFRSG